MYSVDTPRGPRALQTQGDREKGRATDWTRNSSDHGYWKSESLLNPGAHLPDE